MAFRKRVYWILGLTAAVILVATGAIIATKVAPTRAAGIDDGASLLNQASISLEAAITAAQGAAAGDLGEVDLEMYQGKLVFNIDIGKLDVKVDAANGAVLAQVSDDEEGPDEAEDSDSEDAAGAPGEIDDGASLLDQASISLEAAITAAQGAATGDLGEVDLEMYQGKLVFNIDIGKLDVKVDAANGAVLAQSPEGD